MHWLHTLATTQPATVNNLFRVSQNEIPADYFVTLRYARGTDVNVNVNRQRVGSIMAMEHGSILCHAISSECAGWMKRFSQLKWVDSCSESSTYMWLVFIILCSQILCVELTLADIMLIWYITIKHMHLTYIVWKFWIMVGNSHRFTMTISFHWFCVHVYITIWNNTVDIFQIFASYGVELTTKFFLFRMPRRHGWNVTLFCEHKHKLPLDMITYILHTMNVHKMYYYTIYRKKDKKKIVVFSDH